MQGMPELSWQQAPGANDLSLLPAERRPSTHGSVPMSLLSLLKISLLMACCSVVMTPFHLMPAAPPFTSGNVWK